MKVSWTPPDVDGGSPIIGYLLEYKEKTSTDWTPVNVDKSTDTTVVVKSLDENTEYRFRVYAENEIGGVTQAHNQTCTKHMVRQLICLQYLYMLSSCI